MIVNIEISQVYRSIRVKGYLGAYRRFSINLSIWKYHFEWFFYFGRIAA